MPRISSHFRPPVSVRREEGGAQSFIIYRCGKASEPTNPDLYSAKRTCVHSGSQFELHENAAYGGVVLAGHGSLFVPGKEAVQVEAVSIYPDRDTLGGDEFFVAACAAGQVMAACHSLDDLTFHQHFASNSNPESTSLTVPEYLAFAPQPENQA